jgi:hypothetical protein
MLVWEEIHGFSSPGEYRRFVQYIEEQAKRGRYVQIRSTQSVRTWFTPKKTRARGGQRASGFAPESVSNTYRAACARAAIFARSILGFALCDISP